MVWSVPQSSSSYLLNQDSLPSRVPTDSEKLFSRQNLACVYLKKRKYESNEGSGTGSSPSGDDEGEIEGSDNDLVKAASKVSKKDSEVMYSIEVSFPFSSENDMS